MTSLRYPLPMMASMGDAYTSAESSPDQSPTNDLGDILDVLRGLDEEGQLKNQMFSFPEVKIECKTSPQSVCDEEIVELTPDEVPSSSSTDFVGVCAVCGAPARCFHYDVPSCNGCKTFFRRTIVTERAYTCARNGNCKIDCSNRTLCRHCRFNRCVAVGMNPAAIQLPSNMDVNKITKAIQKRRLELTEEGGGAGPVVKVEPKSLYFNEHFYERIVDGLLYVEFKADQLRWSTFNPAEMENLRDMELEGFLKSSSFFKFSEKFERATDWPVPVEYPLNMEERVKSGLKPFAAAKYWSLMDLLIVIETAKTIPAFQQLSIQDQKTLMKQVAIVNVLLIEAYFSVSSKAHTLMFPDGVTPIKFRNDPSNLEVEVYCRMLEPFYRLHLSKEEYVLMKAIILFQADCPGISPEATEILEKAREEYSSALLRLMQAKHGTLKGASRFANAISIIYNLHLFAQKHRQLHLLIRIRMQEVRRKFLGDRGPVRIIETLF
uniref:Nuclear receptor domain-containing protein n=1 Tax=Steinernema glaseri TaxID=37863 RepID=A0A1I8AND2_9BILA